MWRKLGIEPGEGRVFAWGAAALFLLGWTDASLRNVSETLFNKRVGVEHLPLAFLVNSLLLVATTWTFGRMAARSDRFTLLPRTFIGFAVALVPLWLAVRGESQEAVAILVIAAKQVTSITLLVFWMAMGDLLHGRQAKRLFAPLMAGVTLGTIVGSFSSYPLGRLLGIDALLPISALTLGLGGVAVLPLRGLRPPLERAGVGLLPTVPRRSRTSGARDSMSALWRSSPLFRLLLISGVCGGLLSPMLYFQFQFVATQGTAGEERLLAFYAQFRGWISVAILLAQLLVSGSLFRRIGVPLSTALSPLVYLLGFLGLSVRLSLPAGVGAMTATKLQDNAVYDPALRVLYNLFPEETRPRATAILEGPVKRGGNAIGNLVVMLALALGSALWVGYAALPIALLALAAALVLWRQYPRLLLEASASRRTVRDLEGAVVLDPATVRALVPEMCSDDPERTRVAVALVSEAPPARAARALADAASRTSEVSRPIVVGALDRVLEGAIARPIHSPEAARLIGELLADPSHLSERDHADLAQAYGRLVGADAGRELLEDAWRSGPPAVKLAALAALFRRHQAPPDAPDIDAALAEALAGEPAAARRTAREEYRALLLGGAEDGMWIDRLEHLAAALTRPDDRAETAEALAEVAVRHGERAAVVRSEVLALRDDADPRVRAALLRYAGHARLVDEVSWLIDHVGSDRDEWAEAARDGLRALGPASSDRVLRELSFGKRSKRIGLLEVIRELDVSPETLGAVYRRELDRVERDCRYLAALEDRPAFALVRGRLEERAREGLHIALLLLAATTHEERIAQLGERLRQMRGGRRQYAIVLEALEAVLPSDEKPRLVPLLEDPDLVSAVRRLAQGSAPSLQEVLRELGKDADEVTRLVANGVAVAAGFEVEDDSGVDAVEKVMHLKQIPVFEGLTVRQLVDIAAVVNERTLTGDEWVVRQGDIGDRFYLVVEGVVHIVRGETLLAEIGPGGFFGEIALFEGIARTASAVTRSRVRLLDLGRGDLIQLIEEVPGIGIALLQTMSRRVREITDRLVV